LTIGCGKRLRQTSWSVNNILGYNYNYLEFTNRMVYAQNTASGGSPTNGAADNTLDQVVIKPRGQACDFWSDRAIP